VTFLITPVGVLFVCVVDASAGSAPGVPYNARSPFSRIVLALVCDICNGRHGAVSEYFTRVVSYPQAMVR
jgi:hypothetical protein